MRGPEEGIRNPEAGISDACELLCGTGNKSWVLCKSNKVISTTDLSLWPQIQGSSKDSTTVMKMNILNLLDENRKYLYVTTERGRSCKKDPNH